MGKEKEAEKGKKKKHLGWKITGIIFLVLFFIVAGWILFCYIDRINPISAVPEDFSLYVRTDSFWDSAEPLLDLKAADVLLSSADAGNLREQLVAFRSSSLRENVFVKMLASRRIDFAMYGGNNFVAVVDSGTLSWILRLFPLFYEAVSVEDLSFTKSDDKIFFTYSTEDSVFYGAVIKNLIIISSSMDLIIPAASCSFMDVYSNEEYSLLLEPMSRAFRITADSSVLVDSLLKENEILGSLTRYISFNGLSTISFGITDKHISIEGSIPGTVDSGKNPSLAEIFSRESQVPLLLTRLPDSVQYYSLLSLGTLDTLKDGVIPLLPNSQNVSSLLEKADSLSRMTFSLSVDDILGWMGEEYAVLGLEGHQDPVFAISIADEEKRQQVFNKLTSTILVNENSSLLLNGVRIPQIKFPGFLTSLLSAFGVNLPSPYYVVSNGFVFFSQAPENLSQISNSLRSSQKLVKSSTWKSVSEKQKSYFSASLYYNLERSMPFFMRSNKGFSEVLKLYGIGRADIRFRDGFVDFQLEADGLDAGDSRSVPGYPYNPGGTLSSAVYVSSPRDSRLMFVQNGTNVVSLNPVSLESALVSMDDTGWIIPSEKKGLYWAMSKRGTIWHLNESLEILDGSPFVTGVFINSPPVEYMGGLLFSDINDFVYYYSLDKGLVELDIPLEGSLRGGISVLGDYGAVYSKSFLGQIFILKNLSVVNAASPIEVFGIASGAPAIMKDGAGICIGFVNQDGEFCVYSQDGTPLNSFPLKLSGQFFVNAKAGKKYFYLISSEGDLHRVSLNGDVLTVKIPGLKAKTGEITVYDYNSDGKEDVFISGDGNLIYGFDENLELLVNFPVSGWGIPGFVDVNGDKKAECLCSSIDNRIHAWKIQ